MAKRCTKGTTRRTSRAKRDKMMETRRRSRRVAKRSTKGTTRRSSRAKRDKMMETRSVEVAPRQTRRAASGFGTSCLQRLASALRASNEASPRQCGLASALRASNEASPREFGRSARRAVYGRGSARRAVEYSR